MKKLACVGVMLLLCLSACGEKNAEEQIRRGLAEIQEAVEDKNNAGVRKHLSEYFRAGKDGVYTMGKKDVRAALAGYFLRHKNITVKLTKIEIELNQNDEKSAKMKALALILGAENLLPDNADLIRVEGEWVEEAGEWRLKSFGWH